MSDKLKKAWGVTWNGLETTLRLLEKRADAFPPLKSAVGGLVACLDLKQAVIENHEEYEKLVIELIDLANNLQINRRGSNAHYPAARTRKQSKRIGTMEM